MTTTYASDKDSVPELDAIRETLMPLKKSVDQSLRSVSTLTQAELDRTASLAQKMKRLAKVDADLNALASALPDTASLDARRGEYRARLEFASAKLRKEFGVELAREATAAGLEVTGHYPDLVIGFFTLETEFEQELATLWYGPKQERLGRLRLDAKDIVAGIEKTRSELGSGLGVPMLAEKVGEAYRRAQADAKPAKIGLILSELAFLVQGKRFLTDPRREHYRSYSRADFSYDLHRLAGQEPAEGGGTRIRLTIATRAMTRNRRDFLWVPGRLGARGNYYSHLAVEEAR